MGQWPLAHFHGQFTFWTRIPLESGHKKSVCFLQKCFKKSSYKHFMVKSVLLYIYRGVEETKLSLAAVNAIVQSGRSGLIKKGKDALDTLKKGKALDWKVILK